MRPINILFLLFCLFPFTQIIKIDTYNQPYAILTAAILIVINPKILLNFTRTDSFILTYLAILGLVLYIFTLINGFTARHLSYLLSYVSPLLIAGSCYAFLLVDRDTFIKVLNASIVVWILTCSIQKFYNLNFLTFLVTESDSLAIVLAESGRGVIGLAPESTHNGFQMFIMGASLYLLGGHKPLAVICGLSAIYFSGSSSLLLACFMGSFVWACLNPVKNIWYFFILGFAFFIIGTAVPLLNPDTRMASLIKLLIYDRTAIVYFDASVSARLGGMYLPIKESISTGLLPNGMSIEAWAELKTKLEAENSWVSFISNGGPASGFGLILIHAGIFALIPLIYFMKIFIFDGRNNISGILLSIVFFIFLGQLYLATPSFGFMLAVALANRSTTNPYEQEHPSQSDQA